MTGMPGINQTVAKELETLLLHMLTPRTDVVRAATEELNKRLRKPDPIPIFVHFMMLHPEPGVRHCAAVLTRMRIIGLWNKLGQDNQNKIKTLLLPALAKEPNNLVRAGIASVVGIVARVTVPSNQWPELLNFLFECTKSPLKEHREVGMKLFDSLTENIGDVLRPHSKVLYQIFAKGLTDPEISVRIASLKAIGSLMEWATTDEDIQKLGELIPHTLTVLAHCLKNGLLDEANRAFELYDEIVEMSVPVVVPYIPMLAKAMLEIGTNKEIDMSARQSALTVIQWIAAHKLKVLVKNDLLVPCIKAAFALCNEFDDEDDDDPFYLPAHEFGCQMIDHFAMVCATDKVLPLCMEYVKHFIQSNNPNERRAALNVLAVIAEGCSDVLSENIEPLLQFVYKGFSDSDNKVQEAACICLGQFATHLQPNILEHHEKVVPMIIASMNNAPHHLIMKCCYALEAFCESLGEKMTQHLELVMRKLVELLQTGDTEVREIAVAAIAAAADAASRNFTPFYPRVLEMMKVMMALDRDEHLSLRARAMECVGVVALAIGPEAFAPLAQTFMQLAGEGMKLESCELREFTFTFFRNICECLGRNGFRPFLPTCLSLCLEACLSSEGAVFFKEKTSDEESGGGGAGGGGGGAGVEGIEEDDELNPTQVSLPTAFLEEKAAAVYAVVMFAKVMEAEFVPFLPKTLEVLLKMAKYDYAEVRQNTMDALAECVIATYKAFPYGWTAGVDTVTGNPQGADAAQIGGQQQQLQQVLAAVAGALFKRIHVDPERSVVGKAFTALAHIAKALGPPAIVPLLNKFTPALLALLKGSINCQRLDEEEYEDEEVAENRELSFLDCVCDALIDLAQVLGPTFEQRVLRGAVLKSLLKYKQEGPDYFVMISGVLAESTKAMKANVVPYLKQFFTIAVEGLSSDNEELWRNCIYFCGVLCQSGGTQTVQYYSEVLKRMTKVFGSKDPFVVDNICGAIARMIIAAPNNVPLEHYGFFLKSLPLKADFEETEVVYTCILLLFQANHPILSKEGVIPHLVSVFSQVLGHPKLGDNLQNGIVSLLKVLIQKNGPGMQQIVTALPPPLQQNLAKYLR